MAGAGKGGKNKNGNKKAGNKKKIVKNNVDKQPVDQQPVDPAHDVNDSIGISSDTAPQVEIASILTFEDLGIAAGDGETSNPGFTSTTDTAGNTPPNQSFTSTTPPADPLPGDTVINGHAGDNVIVDLSGNNTVNTLGGSDTITTGGGNDTINAGDGANVIDAGSGINTVNTGNGKDEIRTGGGKDEINAGNGENVVDAGDGANTISTGNGKDVIRSGSGSDEINAGEGENTITDAGGDNTINGGSQKDVITAGGGSDEINAGEGENVIDAGDGANTISGGSQKDVITSGKDADVIHAGDGENVITDAGGTNRITAGSGNDRITTGSGKDEIFAGDGNNIIDAGGGENLIHTGGGGDVIVTGDGKDTVYAAGGSDTLILGGGADLAYMGAGDDIVHYTVASGAGGSAEIWGEDGSDTLQLKFTRAEAQGADLADLAGFREQIAGKGWFYEFKSLKLTARQFEKLEIIAPVVANADTAQAVEDGSGITIDVLANDTDLLAADKSKLTITGIDTTGLVGTAAIDPGQKTITYDPGTAFQHLAEGETTQVQFTYTLEDDQGYSDTATVTITITGTNDAPVITSEVLAGQVVEKADGAPGENTGNLTTTGDITFTDVDLADDHAVSPTGTYTGAGTALGALSVVKTSDTTGTGTGGKLTWTYTAPAGALDSLGLGETKVETFTISLNDGQGGLIEKTITVTLTGTNDAPKFTVAEPLGGASANGSPTNALNLDGQFVTVTDPNVGASEVVPHVSVQAVGDGAYDWYKFTVTQPNSTVMLDIDVTREGSYLNDAYLHLFDASGTLLAANDDSYIDPGSTNPLDSFLNYQFLNAGVYYVAVGKFPASDSSAIWNGTGISFVPASNAYTLNISLENAASSAAFVTEITDGAVGEGSTTQTRTGNLLFSDVDTLDTHTASFLPAAGGYRGTFALTPVNEGSDSLGWTFSVADGALDDLAAGQSLKQTYNVTVNDGNGGTDTQAVTITLKGTNDAPVAVADTEEGSENEVLTIDVLGNDTDVDAGHSLTLLSGSAPDGKGSVAVDGNKLVFDPVTAFDHLAQDATEVVTLSYAMEDEHGAQSTSTVTVTLKGTNDSASISGISTGVVTEDGTLSASGALTLSDADAGQSVFQAVNAADLDTQYGAFTFNASTGNWSFTLDNLAAQTLNAGQTVDQLLTVTSADGTASKTIEVTVTGAAEGSFENGLDGWQTIGSASRTQGMHNEGLWSLQLSGNSASDAGIETFLGVSAGTLDGIANDGDPNTSDNATFGAAAKKSVALLAGQKISIDYYFDATDYAPFNDFAFSVGPNGQATELVDIAAVGNHGDSGWKTVTFEAATDGLYTFGIGAVNTGDEVASPNLYIDNVHVVDGYLLLA